MGAAAGGGWAVPGSGGGVAVAAGGVVVRLGRTNSSLMQCFLVIVKMNIIVTMLAKNDWLQN